MATSSLSTAQNETNLSKRFKEIIEAYTKWFLRFKDFSFLLVDAQLKEGHVFAKQSGE